MKLFTAWTVVAVALYGSAAGVSAGRMRTSLRQKAAVDPAATKVIALDTSIVPTWEELGGAELTQKVRLYRVVKFWKALEARDKEEAALLFADPDDESAATAKIDAFYEGALNCLYQQRELEHTDTVYTDITLINIKLCIIKDVKIPKFNVLPSQDWPVNYRKGVLVDFLEAEKTQTEEEKEADAKAAEKLATSPAVVEGNADAPQDTGDVTLPPTDTSASSSDAPLAPSSIDENPDTSAPSDENPDTTAPSDENPDTTAPSGENPDTSAPSDENPDTTAPSDENPDTTAPSDENPDTSAPSTDENPDTSAPSTDENPDTSAPSGSSDENPNDVPGTNGSDSSNDEDNTNAPSGSQPSGDQPGENPSEPDTSAPSGSQPASDQPGENPSEPDTNAPSGSQPSADQPNQPDQPGENPSEPDTNAPSGSQTTGDQPNGDQPSENPSEPDTSAPSGSQPMGDQPEQPDQPGENPAEPDTAAPSGSQPTGDQPSENPSEPDTSAPSGSQPGENPDTASPSGSQPTGDQPGENPSEPDTAAPSGSQPGETPSEPTSTEPITEEPLVPTVPAALTVPAADVRTDVVAPDPSSWKLDPRSPNVPPLWALDWDRSNSVSKKEWYLYLNRIEKVASGIIAETNSQDAKAVQLLSQLVDFHYTVLRMCIDKKFSQDNISMLQSPEFEVAAQWIEDNCYVKFRYSLLGQLPPFQLIAKANKTITPKEAEVWFAKQVKIAKNDLNVKQIVGTASGMENMLDYLNTCTFELLQAAGKELINREIFYAAEDQITKCTMAKLGMS